jgi:hypothetical protein
VAERGDVKACDPACLENRDAFGEKIALGVDCCSNHRCEARTSRPLVLLRTFPTRLSFVHEIIILRLADFTPKRIVEAGADGIAQEPINFFIHLDTSGTYATTDFVFVLRQPWDWHALLAGIRFISYIHSVSFIVRRISTLKHD